MRILGGYCPCSFILGWAFHRLRKPPFPWFARVIAWAGAITRTSCQGLMLVLKYYDSSILLFLTLIVLLSCLGSEFLQYSTKCNFTNKKKKKKKAARIINFQPRNFHTSPLFKQNLILKFQDKIFLESILFASKSFSSLSPSIFNAWFRFSSDQHNYETSSSMQGNHMKPFYKTNRYGKYSMGSIQL